MNFSLSEEQQMIVATTRDFVQEELYPHEQEIERTGVLPEELLRTLKAGSDLRGMKTLHQSRRSRGFRHPVRRLGRGADAARQPQAHHRVFDRHGYARLQVAATCLGRAERALELAKQWAVDRTQFGQQIGKFQGVAFKLADMAVELRAAELLTLEAAWKLQQKTATDMDMAIAKLKATEMLALVADEALQIHGGMGLMTELPLERIWRDARIERIWDGTSEVQRHIISRALLRPLGG
jgi:alkylation response protein AidB-like acyl-CoA dehydrogenase